MVNCVLLVTLLSSHADSLFVGLNLSVSELCVEPKNQRITMYQVYEDGGKDQTEYAHHVLIAEGEGAEKFVFDLTCVQYGSSKPVHQLQRIHRHTDQIHLLDERFWHSGAGI